MAETDKTVKKAAKKSINKAAKKTVKKAATKSVKKAVKKVAKAPVEKAVEATVKEVAAAPEKKAAGTSDKKSANVLNLTLVRSKNGRLASHKACVRGLGLRKIHQTVQVIDTPENRGMINKVRYLLDVEEV